MFRNKQRKRNLVVVLMALAVVAMAGAVQANELPIADAGEDVSMFFGRSAYLHGTATDPDGDPVLNPTWLWTIKSKPAGSLASLFYPTTQDPVFNPDLTGDYVISLIVSDGTDWSLPDTVDIHVTLNLPPVAIATADVTTGTAPLTVNFDSSQSFDPEGSPVTTLWLFDDGSRSYEIAPTHVFEWAGTYLVRMYVKDDWGQPAQDSLLIEVLPAGNQPPVASPTGTPLSGPAPLTVQFAANASDADGDSLSYLWAFGDGTESTLANPSHLYTAPGIYTAWLTVTDGTDDVTGSVTITVLPAGINLPVADAGPDQDIFFGKTALLYGTATDSDGNPILNPTWLWTIDVKPAGSNAYLSDPTRQDPFFIPDLVGDYVLSLVVSDGTNQSLPDSITVHVALNLPPVAIATADVTTGPAPLTVNFDASQSYDPEGGPVTYEWFFADGSYSFEIAPTHVFQWPYTYLVALEVTDGWGQITLDTILITVTEPISNIEVSPAEYDFGEVELGTSSTVIVTISNAGGADLTVNSIEFADGSIADFAITTVPTLPAVVPPGGILGDVVITYTPSAAGLASAVLNIGSDDPDEPLAAVSLIGAGVVVEPPPSEQIQAILDFFDASVEDGTLVGDGPGNSAENRLNAMRNMIETVGDLIEDGLLDDACQQLQDAYKKTDGEPRPPDFVTGEAASVLATLIQDLMTSIGCG